MGEVPKEIMVNKNYHLKIASKTINYITVIYKILSTELYLFNIKNKSQRDVTISQNIYRRY